MTEEKPLLKDLPIVVVDIETTGLDKEKHEIIELAFLIYDQNKDKVVDSRCRKTKPRHIETANPVALEINGYKKNKHLYQYDIKEAVQEFYNMTQNSIFLGVNITAFDIPFIEKYFVEFGIEQSISRHRKLELSSLAWPVLKDTETALKLATMCDFYGISNEGEHTALVDCKRTLAVYRKVMGLDNG